MLPARATPPDPRFDLRRPLRTDEAGSECIHTSVYMLWYACTLCVLSLRFSSYTTSRVQLVAIHGVIQGEGRSSCSRCYPSLCMPTWYQALVSPQREYHA